MSDLSTRDVLRDVFPVHPEHVERPEEYVNLSLYLEARTFLHGLLLVEDKLSMAHGLETRLPFLDNELVEFAQSLPVHLKLGSLRRGRARQRERAGRQVGGASIAAPATARCCCGER